MRKGISWVILMTVSICITQPIHAQVKVDWDHKAEFAAYKTYSWLKADGGNSLWSERLQQDVDTQLAEKGWTRVPADGDATITGFRKTTSEQSLETLYDGFGGGWRWRGFGDMGMSTTTTETVKVGNVVVDIFDSHSQKLLWRGKDSDDLSGNIDRNIEKLQSDVRKMFKRFPPK